MPYKISCQSQKYSQKKNMPSSGVSKVKKMVCFDIGNVLIKLGKSTKEIFDIEDEEELHFLLKCFSHGNINSLFFLKKLQSIIKRKYFSINEIENIFIHKRIDYTHEGILELIADLKEKGIRIAIISNTNELHWSYLEKILPIEKFDEILLSHIYQVEKPDKRIYQILEERTGLKDREILFFDDIQENIYTALSLGWNANKVPLLNPVEFMRKILNENKIL